MSNAAAGLPYVRHPIEIESPEERGYGNLRCNLTESSYTDGTLEEFGVDLRGLVLCYGDHLGHAGLRELIASSADGFGAEHLSPEDVILTPGAAAALFFVNSSLLGPGRHIVVEHNNYATNLTTPRLLGAEVDLVSLAFDDAFQLNLDHLEAAVRPTTALISVTTPHNPTGSVLAQADLERLCDIADRNGTYLLVDETYRDFVPYAQRLPLAASLYQRAISVSSMSKAFGLPGLRIGWAVCRDRDLSERLLAAKEQIAICGATLDESAAFQVLEGSKVHLERIHTDIDRRRNIVNAFFDRLNTDVDDNGPLLEWIAPRHGVVCFPRLRSDIDPDAFYRHLNEVEGTFVGDGHWFESSRRHFRLGFGWPADNELIEGLAAIERSARISVGTAGDAGRAG